MLNRRKFTALLAALLCLMVLHPLVAGRGDFWTAAYVAFIVAVFVGACLVLFEVGRSRIIAVLLGVPTAASFVKSVVWPAPVGGVVGEVVHVFPVAFFGYTVVTILRTIFRKPEVSADEVNGAFCGYLLLALAFGHVYSLLEEATPGSFLLQEHIGPMPPAGGRRHALLTYFSLITLTTVGYGDILPRHPQGRTLAAVEAVIGQFYVAVVVAQLIALKVSTVLQPPGDAQPGVSDGSSPNGR